jgi:hypothetical protein
VIEHDTRDDGAAGRAVEHGIREIAAELGVADFVFHPLYVLRGQAEKEISDGLLICGRRGSILQVKSRGGSVAMADDRAQAVRWANRELRSAIKQAKGSRKHLKRLIDTDGSVPVRPLRSSQMPAGRQDELDLVLAEDPSGWPLIVVLDHPGLPPFEAELPDDTFVITSSDWAGLMSAVRSIAGLLEYVRRCLLNRPALAPAIGDEWRRFLALCEADQGTSDDSPTWGPWLSTAALEDPRAADMYQHVIDRSWPVGSPLPAVPPGEHRLVTEFLDDVPPSVRVDIGNRWLSYVRSTASGGQASGISVMPGKAIFFLVHRSLDLELPPKAMRARLGSIAIVRSWELQRAIGARPLLAVGAFCHPGATDYIFAHVDGAAPPDAQMVQLVHDDVGELRLPTGLERLASAKD